MAPVLSLSASSNRCNSPARIPLVVGLDEMGASDTATSVGAGVDPGLGGGAVEPASGGEAELD
jgi:hypothetical protein